MHPGHDTCGWGVSLLALWDACLAQECCADRGAAAVRTRMRASTSGLAVSEAHPADDGHVIPKQEAVELGGPSALLDDMEYARARSWRHDRACTEPELARFC